MKVKTEILRLYGAYTTIDEQGSIGGVIGFFTDKVDALNAAQGAG